MTVGEVMTGVWSQEDLAKAARDDLGEVEGRLPEDLAHIRAWISKSPHLQNIRKDDDCLTEFLRGCKFSLERTKEKLDFHFSVRGHLPSWFSDWDPRQESLAHIIRAGIYLPLQYDKHGRRVILMRNGAVDPATMKVEESFKVSTMMMEAAMEGDSQAQIRGVVLLQDMEGMTTSHALQMTPVVVKKAMTVWQEGYPAQPKALHFLNLPPVMESIYKLFDSFQKEKMRKRNHIHPKGDMTKVIEDLGKEVLPIEYGGTGPSVADLTQYWIQKMEDRREWLMEQTKYKTQEDKRPGKPKLHSDIFGIEGSFRKLEID